MHLFLSPHPDDVPLSCGGTMYHLREALDETTILLTVMSGDPPQILPDTPIVRELHERWQVGESPMEIRRQEDENAAIVLSARSIIHTGVPDCVYRTANGVALYPDEASLFGNIHPHDTLLALLLATTLPYESEVTHVYAPLGVGHHVDHQIVRDWGIELMRRYPGIEVLFYEEYPYCEQPEAVEHALKAFPAPLIEATKVLRDSDVMIKLVALQNYQSQISTFWHSIEEMDARITNYMTRNGTPVERFWRIITEREKQHDG
jgi:LmbE family N-acetylglucosaminyl deacetylase